MQYTCVKCMRNTHAQYACAICICNLHAQYACPICMHKMHAQYSFPIRMHNMHAEYACATRLHNMHAQAAFVNFGPSDLIYFHSNFSKHNFLFLRVHFFNILSFRKNCAIRMRKQLFGNFGSSDSNFFNFFLPNLSIQIFFVTTSFYYKSSVV